MKRITFCGHNDRYDYSRFEKQILDSIESFVQDDDVEFLLGSDGWFDGFAHELCITYKLSHPNAKLVFVCPYQNETYLKTHEHIIRRFDMVETAPLEAVPHRLKIIRRNAYMVDNADVVIAYVDHGWGGAAMTYRYAVAQKKRIINFGAYKG